MSKIELIKKLLEQIPNFTLALAPTFIVVNVADKNVSETNNWDLLNKLNYDFVFIKHYTKSPNNSGYTTHLAIYSQEGQNYDSIKINNWQLNLESTYGKYELQLGHKFKFLIIDPNGNWREVNRDIYFNKQDIYSLLFENFIPKVGFESYGLYNLNDKLDLILKKLDKI